MFEISGALSRAIDKLQYSTDSDINPITNSILHNVKAFPSVLRYYHIEIKVHLANESLRELDSTVLKKSRTFYTYLIPYNWILKNLHLVREDGTISKGTVSSDAVSGNGDEISFYKQFNLTYSGAKHRIRIVPNNKSEEFDLDDFVNYIRSIEKEVPNWRDIFYSLKNKIKPQNYESASEIDQFRLDCQMSVLDRFYDELIEENPILNMRKTSVKFIKCY